MESRNACEIKLKQPLKFVTGRIDCDNNDEVIDCIDAESIEDYDLAEAGFVTCKKEVKSFIFCKIPKQISLLKNCKV